MIMSCDKESALKHEECKPKGDIGETSKQKGDKGEMCELEGEQS